MSKPEAEQSVTDRTALLEEALQRARNSDADFFDARANVSDLRFLRLQALGDALAAITANRNDLDSFLTLKAVPGDPPRLIVDAASHIAMDPDPRTYSFVHDGPESRKVLFESQSRSAVEKKVTEYIAHRILEHERESGQPPQTPEKEHNINSLTYFPAWAFGALVGASAVYVYFNRDVVLTSEIFRSLTGG